MNTAGFEAGQNEIAEETHGAEVQVPMLFAELAAVDRNPARQLKEPAARGRIIERRAASVVVRVGSDREIVFSRRRSDGGGVTLFAPRDAYDACLASGELAGTWLRKPQADSPADVVRTYRDAFTFIASSTPGEPGLRPPQIGAVHAAVAHWIAEAEAPGTIVMPTGTGKTDTMIALLVAANVGRLLVVVPSDALRDQTAHKFETLGILRSVGAVPETAANPVVGRLRHKLQTPENAIAFAGACNVVVTTPNALRGSSADVRAAFLSQFDRLVVDEAHHVAATSWKAIRDEFGDRGVLQFTATPFREDGRALGGRQIFTFPLAKAQAGGYFSRIQYKAVLEMADRDRQIASTAVDQLRQDRAADLDHMIMARVSQIARAREVLGIYQGLAPEFQPILLHSENSASERRAALAALGTRASRIIVCVDMLGEGFDLPALKIAAIHDPHLSLPITLQFIGRFARPIDGTPGSATIVVGRPSGPIDPNLRRLFAIDADWNPLIEDISQQAVAGAREISDFEAGFGQRPSDVDLRSLMPKMSTVVFRTTSDDWDVTALSALFPDERLLTVPIAINAAAHVVWFIAETRTPVQWGIDVPGVEEVLYSLYVIHWDPDTKLLYINSSDNSTVHQDVAEALCGEVRRVRGPDVYRSLGGLTRLVPTNVGLLDSRNRSRTFLMLAGPNVTEGFPDAEAQTKTQTNIFGFGYDNGERVSVGASLKGRIWSYQVAPTIKHWVDWCHAIGAKLLNEAISVEEVMASFIRPVLLDRRPDLVPLAVDWPWQIYAGLLGDVHLEVEGQSQLLVDSDLELVTHDRVGDIRFRVLVGTESAEYVITFDANGMTIAPTGVEAEVVSRLARKPLSGLLNSHGVYVLMEREAFVTPAGILLRPARDVPPFDQSKLVPLDWTGIDLTVESQGQARRADSIQARVIRETLNEGNWDIVFDDDGNGELADIVAIRATERAATIRLIHCKGVLGGRPRHQIEDLYIVCGQAQKSVGRTRSIDVALSRLLKREARRLQGGGQSRFVQGDTTRLFEIADAAPVLQISFELVLAQPGVAKAGITAPQLELLAATETYVRETLNAPMRLYCSA